MKLKKETESADKGRWYQDACGAAHGLELLGERWALLILRELMFGPRRFGALRAGLPGISAKALTERLQRLQAEGIVMQRTLPPPASIAVYELTPWGYEAEPIFRVLGRWATRSPTHDPSLPLSAASLMLSFTTMFDRAKAGGVGAVIGFRLVDDLFRVSIDAGGLRACRGALDGVGVVISAPPALVAAVVYGGLPLDQAEAAGSLALDGDRALAAWFIGLFPLPDKAPLPGCAVA